MPALAAVGRGDDPELVPVRRIGQSQAAPVVEERHAVVERVRVVVLEGERPALARVRGDVDPRVAAVPDREDDGVVGVESLDVSELQQLRAGRADLLPGRAAVDRAQDRSHAAARPGRARADGRHSAQRGSRARRRVVPAVCPVGSGRGEGRNAGSGGERCRRPGEAEYGKSEGDAPQHGEKPNALSLRSQPRH